jgi:hypothetical protein
MVINNDNAIMPFVCGLNGANLGAGRVVTVVA